MRINRMFSIVVVGMLGLTLPGIIAGAIANTTASELKIAEEGEAKCVIVVAADPSPAEQTASKELQSYLQQVTGAEFSIRTCSEVASDTPQIVVGPSERLTELLPDINLDTIGDDGILIRTVDNALVLAGPRPRGSLYAVYTFLEDVVGCRWWTSTESTIPSKPNLTLPPLDIRYAPKLKTRTAYYRDALTSPFAARLKTNGSATALDETYGGRNRFAMFVHTFYPLLPPEKYFAEHPEWYSLIDGKRTTQQAQLCLSNDSMRAELTSNALNVLRSDPEAKLISISQNDWHGACQCERCQAVVTEEGSEAGPLLQFVNAVAEQIEKEFPDVLVETLAYQYTRTAPKHVRPQSNVVVRLCSIECSFNDPLGGEKYGGSDRNVSFRRDIEAWSAISPKLFVWDYVTNFSNYLVPHPNLQALAPNVRFFVDHNVVGLFEQGDAQSGIGDFVALRAYLLAHLMWDPSRDDELIIDEFLNGYYGPAAPYLRDYLELVVAAGQRSGTDIRCFMADTSSWFEPTDLDRATELFASAAKAVANDAQLSARVRRERLVLDHVWLSHYRSLELTAKLKASPFLGPPDPRTACEEFIKTSRANKVGNWRENVPFEQRAETLLNKFGPPAAPPLEVQGRDAADWLDFQDGEFTLHRRNEWADQVDDAAASDGRAAKMPGSHREWAVSLPLNRYLKRGNPWHVYAVARCEATATDGPAMTMGIYDSEAKKSVAAISISVEQSAGSDYRVFDLGTHELSETMYFWAAPTERPNDVQHVYVDRIFLVH